MFFVELKRGFLVTAEVIVKVFTSHVIYTNKLLIHKGNLEMASINIYQLLSDLISVRLFNTLYMGRGFSTSFNNNRSELYIKHT